MLICSKPYFLRLPVVELEHEQESFDVDGVLNKIIGLFLKCLACLFCLVADARWGTDFPGIINYRMYGLNSVIYDSLMYLQVKF